MEKELYVLKMQQLCNKICMNVVHEPLLRKCLAVRNRVGEIENEENRNWGIVKIIGHCKTEKMFEGDMKTVEMRQVNF